METVSSRNRDTTSSYAMVGLFHDEAFRWKSYREFGRNAPFLCNFSTKECVAELKKKLPGGVLFLKYVRKRSFNGRVDLNGSVQLIGRKYAGPAGTTREHIYNNGWYKLSWRARRERVRAHVAHGRSCMTIDEQGRGVLIIMHDRSRMIIDPRTPTMPGWSMSGFRQPGRHCLHQARSET